MIGRVLEHEDLQRLSKCTRRAHVEAWLKRQGIRYKIDRKGLWTTEAALDEALGIRAAAGNDESYKPEDVL